MNTDRVAARGAAHLRINLTASDPIANLREVTAWRSLLDRIEREEIREALRGPWGYRHVAAALGRSKSSVYRQYGSGRG